jgi:hypothetical protein
VENEKESGRFCPLFKAYFGGGGLMARQWKHGGGQVEK